jgi:hypothetical protein
VHFDGVDDRLTLSSDVPLGPDITVVIVGRPDALGARSFLDLGNSGSGTGYVITPERAVRTGSGDRRWQASASTSASSVTIVRQDGAATSRLATWVDGRRLSVSSTRSARIATAGSTTIGAAPGAAGVAPFAGDVSEVLVYQQSLSTPARAALEQYLGAKYGIAITP